MIPGVHFRLFNPRAFSKWGRSLQNLLIELAVSGIVSGMVSRGSYCCGIAVAIPHPPPSSHFNLNVLLLVIVITLITTSHMMYKALSGKAAYTAGFPEVAICANVKTFR